jgi:hypothetical protein
MSTRDRNAARYRLEFWRELAELQQLPMGEGN